MEDIKLALPLRKYKELGYVTIYDTVENYYDINHHCISKRPFNEELDIDKLLNWSRTNEGFAFWNRVYYGKISKAHSIHPHLIVTPFINGVKTVSNGLIQ